MLGWPTKTMRELISETIRSELEALVFCKSYEKFVDLILSYSWGHLETKLRCPKLSGEALEYVEIESRGTEKMGKGSGVKNPEMRTTYEASTLTPRSS